MFLLGLLSVLALISLGCCGNFLAIVSWPSYSHHILGHRLLQGLVAKGHTVTMVSPYSLENPITNYTNIQIEELKDLIKLRNNIELTNSIFVRVRNGYDFGLQSSEKILSHPQMKNLIKSRPKYDAIIITYFFNDALITIPKQLNAPTIFISTTSTSSWCNHLVGNSAPLSHISHMFLGYVGTFNFEQRVKNYLLHAFERIYRWWIVFPRHTEVVRKYLPHEDVTDLLNEANPLLLVNSHTSSSNPAPKVPNVIEIGGYHLKSTPLSKGLKKILDAAREGVVFFSLGTNVSPTDLSEEQKRAIVTALGKFKGTVLWKWEHGAIEGLPSNVVMKKWFPQEAILAHPNTKVFITQGGMLSVMEAVHNAIPFIGIPILADQLKNVNEAVMRGYGIKVPLAELGEEKLNWALQEIMTNSSYQSNAKLYSTIMRDRVKPPMEVAVYWVEYVARNNGSSHFRNGSMDMKWFQNDLLDIALFLIAAFIILPMLLIYGIVKVYKMYARKVKKQKTNAKKLN